MSHYRSKADELSGQITPPVEPVDDSETSVAPVAAPTAPEAPVAPSSSPGLPSDDSPSHVEPESASDVVVKRLQSMWPSVERRG